MGQPSRRDPAAPPPPEELRQKWDLPDAEWHLRTRSRWSALYCPVVSVLLLASAGWAALVVLRAVRWAR